MVNLHFPFAAVALGAILSAGTCNHKGGSTEVAGITQGKWVLVKLDGNEVAAVGDDEAPYLAVDSTGTHVSGFGGCNRLMGALEINGDSISFPGLVSTRMYCEETQQLENSFLAALHAVKTYSIKGGELVLYDRTERAVLRRAEP